MIWKFGWIEHRFYLWKLALHNGLRTGYSFSFQKNKENELNIESAKTNEKKDKKNQNPFYISLGIFEAEKNKKNSKLELYSKFLRFQVYQEDRFVEFPFMQLIFRTKFRTKNDFCKNKSDMDLKFRFWI